MEKKEIENYLIVPSVLFRMTKLPSAQYSAFCQRLHNLLDKYKTVVTDQVSEHIYKHDRSKAVSTCNEEARKYVELKWTTLDEKISLVSGKDLLGEINNLLQTEYGVSCSLTKIIKNIKNDEISGEVKDVIASLI